MKVFKSDNGSTDIRDIEGDMGEGTRMRLVQQQDGDVSIELSDVRTGQRLAIEFCTLGGGSRNHLISQKLRELVLVVQGLPMRNPIALDENGK